MSAPTASAPAVTRLVGAQCGNFVCHLGRGGGGHCGGGDWCGAEGVRHGIRGVKSGLQLVGSETECGDGQPDVVGQEFLPDTLNNFFAATSSQGWLFVANE